MLTTGGFADSGTFKVVVGGSEQTCAYTGRTENTFTGVTGCSGIIDDGAAVTGSSKQTQANEAAGNPGNGKSKTANGDQNKSAALAVIVLVATTKAFIAPADSTAVTISTPGATAVNKIHAGAKHNAVASADAGNTNDPSAGGIGVAVAVNVAVVSTSAYVAKNVTVNGKSLTVEATKGSGSSVYKAEAISGAGASSGIGVAGSVGVNVVVASTVADIHGGIGDSVAVNGDLTLNATSDLQNTASATAKLANDGSATGIGASVAINVVNDTTSASVGNDVALLGVDDLAMTADATDATTTTANGGASTGADASFSLGAVVAITISNVTTSASVGTGPALSISGGLTAHAIQTASTTTTATGDTKGGTAAIGVSLALVIANHNVDSKLQRSLDRRQRRQLRRRRLLEEHHRGDRERGRSEGEGYERSRGQGFERHGRQGEGRCQPERRQGARH